jgi:hypothetical protein
MASEQDESQPRLGRARGGSGQRYSKPLPGVRVSSEQIPVILAHLFRRASL